MQLPNLTINRNHEFKIKGLQKCILFTADYGHTGYGKYGNGRVQTVLGSYKKILMYEICEQNPVAKSQLINLIET